MASKVVYNNISYDILNAITLLDRDYLILVDTLNISNIIFLESTLVDGNRKYTLPPRNFTIAGNPSCDLKRLQVNFIASIVVEILKQEVNNGSLKSMDELKTKIESIKSVVYSDEQIKSILGNNNLTEFNYSGICEFLESYLKQQFMPVLNDNQKKQSNYLDRPLRTSEGLDYEWLYDLELSKLKDLASSKNRTSEELIYILDALDKREKSDQAINKYTEMGQVKTLVKKDKTAAFIDTILLALITASFALLLLLGIF